MGLPKSSLDTLDISKQYAGDADAPAPRPALLLGMPDGPEGVRFTLDIMRRMVKKFRADPAIRALAESLVADLPSKDYASEVRRLFYFVRDEIRYTQDVNEVETLKTPSATVETRQGDCDDKSALLATLLETLGHPARFVAVGFAPEDFSHVYVETYVGKSWLALDTTEMVEPGWSPYSGPQPILSRMVWHI
jgi:transglutaminase-like putative cysteine protease